MIAYKYFDIGSGVKLPYVGVKFTPSIHLVEEFQSCQQSASVLVKSLDKERLDRKVNLLFFCPEPKFSKVSDSREELESHCLSRGTQYRQSQIIS